MRYTKERFLPQFRGAGKCELCGTWCAHLEAAHVVAAAQGGGRRLNLPINLWAAGPAWSCQCHWKSHHAKVDPWDVFKAVGSREGLPPEFVERQIWHLINAPKDCRPCPNCWGSGSVKVGQRWGFRRHECVCGGVGIVDALGNPWHQPERKFTWQV